MKQAIRVFGVCLLVAGFMVAGCGGDEESSPAGGAADAGQEVGDSPDASGGSPDTTQTPEVEPTSEAKAKYVVKANALCEKRQRQIQDDLKRIVKGLPADGDERAGLARVVEQAFAPGLEAELDELHELGAPQGDETQIEEIFAAIEAVIAEMRENPAAFGRSPNGFAQIQELTGSYGIDACGKVL
jgi:hypothetical protein